MTFLGAVTSPAIPAGRSPHAANPHVLSCTLRLLAAARLVLPVLATLLSGLLAHLFYLLFFPLFC